MASTQLFCRAGCLLSASPTRQQMKARSSLRTAGNRNVACSAKSTMDQKSLDDCKEKVLSIAKDLDRGLNQEETATKELFDLVSYLEENNPTKEPLSSASISGRWELMFTTSDGILKRGRPSYMQPSGPIYQTIDGEKLCARNEERIEPLPGLWWLNQVVAKLSPKSSSFAQVTFRRFKLGPLEVPAPASAVGALDTTFLDEEMRISRGDKGNLFILRMNDKTARLVDPDDPDRRDFFAENTLSPAMNIALVSVPAVVLLFIIINRLPTKA